MNEDILVAVFGEITLDRLVRAVRIADQDSETLFDDRVDAMRAFRSLNPPLNPAP